MIAWLSNRAGEVTVKLGRGEEALEVSAKGVKGLDQDALRELSTHITGNSTCPASSDNDR